MRSFLHVLTGAASASTIAVITGLISYFAFGQTFLISSLYAVGGWFVVFSGTLWIGHYLYLRKNQLSMREYIYIKKNLHEAKLKIARLRKALFAVKNLHTIKQNFEIFRIVKRIYVITKKEPKRFYQAEKFYFENLESIVELTEKYALLATQPKKNAEIQMSLSDTRWTIAQLAESLEKDLYDLLEKDIDHLQFELDVAKHSLSKK
ncbi:MULTISPECIES: 5-bromo-4-chloroindolyl phosphate hydrolysis family protein [Bacillus]|uniref:Protein xpaC n=2 Tax=Bacillus TaxID=1386 RepID=A0A0M4FM10_9BACI|nr:MULTISPECIES: 5-bromo-4-chloroindolyl phosphate hydrolysis family protein [Bacillus]ALC83241.1 protein xpaC [Bacillus gobiensis]MBP1084202.1 5-bromo-4-chloroindolyl phosphate hydrolysis protein [Bacillus capparidis]MED1098206.1 5-bromo-4-chloroindolyl phosphate hydrolysis family protein [Bacillus capparidis]